VEVELVESDQRTLTWMIHDSETPGGLPITGFKVRYLREEQLERQDNVQEQAELWKSTAKHRSLQKEGAGHEYILEGLRPGTGYVLRFSALNEAGWGDELEVKAATLPATSDSSTLVRRKSLLILVLTHLLLCLFALFVVKP